MSESNLPADSTLLTLREGLAEEYVRRIYAGLTLAEKEVGNAEVRIAINDGNTAPSYRIDASVDDVNGRTAHQEILSGRTHKKVLAAKANLLHWSEKVMVLSQIRALMGDIRGFQLPKAISKS